MTKVSSERIASVQDDSVFVPDASAPAGLGELLGGYLARQRWYAGAGEVGPDDVILVESRRMRLQASDAALYWAVVEANRARYQLLVGERRNGEHVAEVLLAHEAAAIGALGESFFYDAVVDSALCLELLSLVSGGTERAERVRPITAEQSNTSLVYDDRIILKLFRRLAEGANPDVEVTTALAAQGFAHVAAPVASWRRGGTDLAFAQEFLAGGSEGWALALTSLRDLYSSASGHPAEAGGDFAAESSRLGRMTAQMHLAMAAAFGCDHKLLATGPWQELVEDIARRLASVSEVSGLDLVSPAAALIARMRALGDPGPAVRVHGDYHLGQVMRTDAGWYVLDFEGEPARPLAERSRPTSPIKDVTGMLRSFAYASAVGLRSRTADELERLEPLAMAWESHNRAAFLDGYQSEPGIEELMPADADMATVTEAYELDKALYEFEYERAYRPEWTSIPRSAIVRLVGASPEGSGSGSVG